MVPIRQKAVIVTKTGATFALANVPKPGPGQILVKVVAAAQNPSDCQFHVHFWGGSSMKLTISFREITRTVPQGQPVRWHFGK